MYCMGSGNFDVVQTALRNLPEYVLLCQGMIVPSSQHYTASVLGLYYGSKLASWKVNCSVFSRCIRIHAQSKNMLFFMVLFSSEHADILLHKAFLVGIYGQIDTSSMISESMKVLHMEATTWGPGGTSPSPLTGGSVTVTFLYCRFRLVSYTTALFFLSIWSFHQDLWIDTNWFFDSKVISKYSKDGDNDYCKKGNKNVTHACFAVVVLLLFLK